MPAPEHVGEFTDSRLVALYDSWEPVRSDHAFYRHLATMMQAQTIVDIGCGTGKLAVELARQGHQVTGVDPSPAMLTMGRRRDGGELVRWIEGDATVLGEGEYDLAVMAGDVVPVITDNRELVATFAAIRRALRPEGRLAFDSLEQYGFDVRDEVRERSETDMAAWRAADHVRREELKRQFRQSRKTNQQTPDADA